RQPFGVLLNATGSATPVTVKLLLGFPEKNRLPRKSFFTPVALVHEKLDMRVLGKNPRYNPLPPYLSAIRKVFHFLKIKRVISINHAWHVERFPRTHGHVTRHRKDFRSKIRFQQTDLILRKGTGVRNPQMFKERGIIMKADIMTQIQ